MPTFTRVRREQLLDVIRAQGSIRISDIAPTLGVSEVTLRRDITALADKGLVLRVHGGAILRGPSDRALPDPGQRGTRTQSPRLTVGMVTPSMDYYWPPVVRGVQAGLARHNARLALRGSSYSTADDRAQITRLLESGEVNGLILAPMVHVEAGRDLLRWLESIDLPVVLLERTVPPPLFTTRIESVTTDQGFSAGLGVRHLASRGHRRIGILASRPSPHTAKLREGWRTACEELGLDIEGVPDEDAPTFTTQDREQRFDSIINACRDSGTTALLVHADREAIALLQHIQDAGLKVPDDLALLAFDDEVAAFSDPPMSAVRPPKFAIGKAAADLIVARIDEGPSRPLHRLTVCPELIVRGSCGPHR